LLFVANLRILPGAQAALSAPLSRKSPKNNRKFFDLGRPSLRPAFAQNDSAQEIFIPFGGPMDHEHSGR
jgi:hypothetical protein